MLAQQYEDGGEVLMECSSIDDDSLCSCSGSSGSGVSIEVFDYPTTGERVSRVAANSSVIRYRR